MADVIQLRRDTASNWTSANPTLASGELGLETDTGKLKLGTGALVWNSLSYYTLATTGYAPLASPTFTGTATAPTVNASTALQIGGTAVTSTAAELNLLDGVSGLVQADLTKLAAVDASAAELNLLDGVSGLVQADLTKLAAVDASATELNKLDALSRGSILYGNASGATTVLTKGTASQILKSDGTDIAWADPAASGASIEATATGAITAGTACKFKSDGTVEQFSKTALAVDELKITELSHDSVDNLESGGASAIGYDSKRNQFIHIQWNGTLSEYVMSIGKIENNTVAFSAGQVIGKNWSTSGSTTPGKAIFYDDVNDRIFFFGGEYGKRWAVGVPVGDSYQFKKDGTGFPNHSGSTWYGGSGRTPMFHNGRMFHISREGTWTIFNAYTYISDESATLTTQELNLNQVNHDYYSQVVDETNSEMLVCMNDGGEDSGYNIYLIDIGGTGTPTEDYDSGLVDSSSDRKDGLQCLCLGSKKYFLSYKNANGKITGQVLTFSGSTPTFHTAVELHSGTSVGPNKSVQLLDGRIFVNWYDDGTIITISGNTVQSGAAEMNAFTNLGMDWGAGGGMAFSSGSDLAVTYFYNGLVGDAIAFSTTTASPDDYVGVAQATVANAAAVTLDVISGTNEALTGLTIGARYYVQRDGTLGTALTGTYAGIAYTATKLLVKG